MKIQININHNYYEENPLNFEKIFTTYNIKKTGNEKKVKSLFSPTFELKLKNENLSNIQITKFKKKRYFDADEESLILRLYSKENIDGDTIYFIQTGLFAGILYYKNCQFNIETKYVNSILKRMLNFVNDIYIDTTPFNAIKDKNNNQFKFIISYLFIQSLEKAAILGLPQEYISHKLKNNKVRGQIDINC
ncbi:hypothetical protein EOM09_03260 [bacterium]|nr:hypothetical protein [bacterium]